MNGLKTICILVLSLLSMHFCERASASIAQPMDTLLLNNQPVYPINRFVYWLKTDQQWTPEEAYTALLSGKGQRLAPDLVIKEGFSKNNFWSIFTVKNIGVEDERILYQLNNPYIKQIQVYIIEEGRPKLLFEMGTNYPFHTRPITYHDFVFPLIVKANSSSIVLIMAHNHGEIFSSKPELLNEKSFQRKEQKLYITLGIIFGIMVFNIIINLFLGISLRDNIHYLYAVYTIAALLWLLSSLGMDFEYIYPNNPKIFLIAQGFSGGITMILMAQLAIVFLQLKTVRGKAYLFLNVTKWVLFLVIPIWTIVNYWFLDYTILRKALSNTYLLAISCVAIGMIWNALTRIKDGFKPAWFYLAAMVYLASSIFNMCFIIIASRDLSALNSPPNSIQQGIIIETIIIFFGIIYRYNLFKQERKELKIKLAEQNMEIMQRIVSAQEEERKRIAQDLHDDVGATLSTLLLYATNIPEKGKWSSEFGQEYSERCQSIGKKALSDLRYISQDLLPKEFSSLGLFNVLENKVEELNRMTATNFLLNMDGDDSKLQENMSLMIYRIINEILNNIVKHAKAETANIEILVNDAEVELLVEDNGIGIPLEITSQGIGLKNIRSRVDFLQGTLNIDHSARGTTFIIDIPLNERI